MNLSINFIKENACLFLRGIIVSFQMAISVGSLSKTAVVFYIDFIKEKYKLLKKNLIFSGMPRNLDKNSHRT